MVVGDMNVDVDVEIEMEDGVCGLEFVSRRCVFAGMDKRELDGWWYDVESDQWFVFEKVVLHGRSRLDLGSFFVY